ncbi:MAG: GNAT family N-acetyltransferase [Actinomycetota bacterium]
MPDTRPGLARATRRALTRTRSRGPREVTELLTARLRENWSSRQRLFLYVREAGPLERPGEGLYFRQAGPEDGSRYARDIGTDSAARFASRLSEDVMCFVVEDGGRLLHASWVTTSAAWTREIRGYLSPPPGDAYVYESFTRADARGRGIYPFALAGIVSHLGRSGVRRVWVGVEESNAPSTRAIEKAGFVRSFELAYARNKGRFRMDVTSLDDSTNAYEFLRLQKDSTTGY